LQRRCGLDGGLGKLVAVIHGTRNCRRCLVKTFPNSSFYGGFPRTCPLPLTYVFTYVSFPLPLTYVLIRTFEF
jgi:hypothetical protein